MNMIWCGLKIKENYHVLSNQFHGNFRSKTLSCRKIKSVFRDVKWCFNASWGPKGLNGYFCGKIMRSQRLEMQWNNIIRISCIYDRSCALSAVKFPIIFTWCFSYHVDIVLYIYFQVIRWVHFVAASWHSTSWSTCLLSRYNIRKHHSWYLTEKEFRQSWSTVCKSIYVVFAVHCNVNPNVKTCKKCKLPPRWIFLYKSWGPKGFIQFEIIINVSVVSFWFIWIPMLWVYGHYKYIYSFSAGIVFIRQNLTSADVRFWRIDGPRTV